MQSNTSISRITWHGTPLELLPWFRHDGTPLYAVMESNGIIAEIIFPLSYMLADGQRDNFIIEY